jgi:hypothetical protein
MDIAAGGNRRGTVMNTVISLDHLATWNEVCDALAFSSLDVLEQKRACEVCCEVAPDSRGGVRVLAEELAWLALAKEALETRSN